MRTAMRRRRHGSLYDWMSSPSTFWIVTFSSASSRASAAPSGQYARGSSVRTRAGLSSPASPAPDSAGTLYNLDVIAHDLILGIQLECFQTVLQCFIALALLLQDV